MAVSNASPKTLTVGATGVAAFRLVTLTNNLVVYNTADDVAVGVTLQAADAGDPVSVALLNAGGTLKVRAAGAITAGECVVWAANGSVAAYSSEDYINGIALDAAGAAGDIVECILFPTPVAVGS